MYESFYGLSARPFDLTSNPRSLFLTDKYREALSHVQYGIETRAGITVLIGDAGIGKTTMLRAALENFGVAPSIVVLSNPALTRSEFLQFLARSFDLPSGVEGSKTELMIELNKTLQDLYARNIPAALVVDEAQSVPTNLLREIRLLANLEVGTQKLLPIVLAGQPELADVLNQPKFQPLKQRVAYRCALERLTLGETAAYLVQRIRSVGGQSQDIFTRGAVIVIHERARGIPRTINVICNNALIAGFARGERPVGRQLLSEVCDHLDLVGSDSPAAATRTPAARPHIDSAASEQGLDDTHERRQVVERLLRRR